MNNLKQKLKQQHHKKMITNAWRSSITGLLLLCGFLSSSAISQPFQVTDSNQNRAVALYNEMAQALRELNFEATLVRSSGTRLEPMTWLHGVYPDGTEVELIVMLNGPDMRILRIGDDTSYYEPHDEAYTLHSDVTFGILPAAFYKNFSELQPHYQVVGGRGVRVSGRSTHFLRILSRDNDRYHYGLWIDVESKMLLKMQMMTPQGDILEQLQVTTFVERENVPIGMSDVRGIPRPPRLYEVRNLRPPQFNLRPQWLPAGFELLRAGHRRVAGSGLPVDYYLFSDGLTEVSVYIGSQEQQGLPSLAVQGRESIVNSTQQNLAVTAVGKVPVSTLQRMVDSMRAVEPKATQP
ncbi:MucB/RseB C-terminal domain-containing protein [Pseudidiomarina sp. YC-516-91]|uniref:MucB/RseB C-terminal domain-containing protein n=1 Tax=Pseudidiomarina salilacus TaxID=3384452 RepID=UPI0039853AAE